MFSKIMFHGMKLMGLWNSEDETIGAQRDFWDFKESTWKFMEPKARPLKSLGLTGTNSRNNVENRSPGIPKHPGYKHIVLDILDNPA